MNNYENPLDNKNYLNKDFQTIYPELLSLVEKLSYKWNPTVSNESDPGVVLLKLNAILADKNNYNIDKNILECFPNTVSQIKNARNLYYQLGYKMHWYESATGEISIMYSDKKVNRSVDIKPFTMFCDSENSIVYTSTAAVNLPLDGTIVKVPVIQGIVKEVESADKNVITAADLDEYNRIYLQNTNVAENGIFISNVQFIGETPKPINFYEWSATDNLYTTDLGNKVYFFGIDPETEHCYIEFPKDIASIIGEGLQIKYIVTSGEYGNIARNVLSKLFSDYYVENESTGENLSLNENNLRITNSSSILNGKEPESIQDAYEGFKKVSGTFKTLVTLLDYYNYITRKDLKLASNGVISDRTNDIQDSYKIITNVGNTPELETRVTETQGTPDMMPFDLKTYVLNWVDVIYNKDTYDKSFDFYLGDLNEPLGTNSKILKALENSKSIQHNFINKKENKILYCTNEYDINLTVIPTAPLTDEQSKEIDANIRLALFRKFNSKEVCFGKGVNYSDVYDVCQSADNRIKAIALNNIEYTTYAHYFGDDGNGGKKIIKEVLPKKINTNQTEISKDLLVKSILIGVTPLFEKKDKFDYTLTQQLQLKLDKNIESMTTNTDIVFDFTQTSSGINSSKKTIGKNESLYFSCPNLIDDTSYSLGCKYEFWRDGDNKKNLDSSTDYVLNADEHLAIYWTTSSEKNAWYTYKIYNKGTILSTNIILNCSKKQTVGERLPSDDGVITNSELQQEIYDSTRNILNSSSNITIKKVNKVNADYSNNFYWIVNNKQNNKYVLKLDKVSKIIEGYNNIFEYNLGQNEYFIYTDKSKSVLNILGMGSTIQFCSNTVSDNYIELKANILQPETIMENGIRAVPDDFWVTIQKDNNFILTENKIIILNEGTDVTITSTTDLCKSIKFNSTGSYKKDTSSYSKMDNLKDFNISFSKGDDSGSLDARVGGLYWEGKSMLNIISSPETPQTLTANQTIILSYRDGEQIRTATLSNCNFQTSIPINLFGGENINVTVESVADGTISGISVYAYSDNPEDIHSDPEVTAQNKFWEVSNGSIIISEPKTEIQKIKLKLPFKSSFGNKFILPVQFSFGCNPADLEFKITYKGNPIELMGNLGLNPPSIVQNKTYYYNLIVPETQVGSDTEIVVTYNYGAGRKVKLYPLIRYDINENFNESLYQDILIKMQELDPNQDFLYVYDAPTNRKIENPLNPMEFFNSEHIYNNYTIPKINKIGITVVNMGRW